MEYDNLYPHQKDFIDAFMSSKKPLLLDYTGVTGRGYALAVSFALQKIESLGGSVLIICPRRMVSQWIDTLSAAGCMKADITSPRGLTDIEVKYDAVVFNDRPSLTSNKLLELMLEAKHSLFMI